jgi:lysozyme
MRPDFELTNIKSREKAEAIAQRQRDIEGAERVEIVAEADGTFTVRAWYGPNAEGGSQDPSSGGDASGSPSSSADSPASDSNSASSAESGAGAPTGGPSRSLSAAGAKFIRSFEGCEKALGDGKFQAYFDPVGVLTIGWGHTNHHGRQFDASSVWTQQECDDVFREDMRGFEVAVNRFVKVPLTQNQFDALVSFCYNCGAGNFSAATLLKLVNLRDFASAAKEFGKWTKAKGVVLKGLVRRRAAEALLFQGIADLDYDGIPDAPMAQLVDPPEASVRVSGFGLDAEFARRLTKVLETCGRLGLDFRISQGLRTPQTQAKYYCQWDQRSPQAIDAAADRMQADGAPWLTSLLRENRDVPRIPRWQTNALPGAGWHQWGEAADCYCYRNGRMVGDGGDDCYRQYATAAQALGLTAGLYFSTPDAGHVQLRSQAGATSLYSWSYIVFREELPSG